MNQFYFSFTLLMILSSVHSAPTACPAAGTTPSLPQSPYNCSSTCSFQARAIASFWKGLSLIRHRDLRNLTQVPTICAPITLGAHNIDEHPSINCEQGLQGVANSIGKLNAYLRLIQQSQRQSYSQDIQALQDLLSGTVLDLYEVLSLTYCNCTEMTNSTNHFTIPQLSTSDISDNCNLAVYISYTIKNELINILRLTNTWLASQYVGPRSNITDKEWLSSHVSKCSPANT